MPSPTQPLMSRLRRAVRPRDVSVGVALIRFVQHHDPEAFALIVQRYGPMVLGVCRRVLGATLDVEDAYQATFLVLVRRAHTVRPPEAVGSWLFAVADRTAVYTRAVRRRRSARFRPLDREPPTAPPDSFDLRAALDVELAKLPVKFRDAVVLCVLEGRSLKDVAGSLGVPVGTLASRLARGRRMLADRLRERGFAVTGTGVFVLLASAGEGCAAPEFDPLAASYAAGFAQLANGVMKMSLLLKLKLVTAVALGVLVCGLFGVGREPGPAVSPTARAAPVPKVDARLSEAQVKECDGWWAQLVNPHAESVQAALRFAKKPSEATLYLKHKLRPLKLDETEVKKLIARLFGEDEKAALEAERDLAMRSPLLVMSLKDVWAEAKTDDQRRRLVYVLLGRMTGYEQHDYELKEHPNGMFTFVATKWVGGQQVNSIAVTVDHTIAMRDQSPSWQRLRRAIYVLEHIGTPEAVKVLEDMATGHPDAGPTRAAKETLGRLGK